MSGVNRQLVFTIDIIDSIGITWNRVADLRTTGDKPEKRVQVITGSRIDREGRYDLDFRVSVNPALDKQDVENTLATLRGYHSGTLRPV